MKVWDFLGSKNLNWYVFLYKENFIFVIDKPLLVFIQKAKVFLNSTKPYNCQLFSLSSLIFTKIKVLEYLPVFYRLRQITKDLTLSPDSPFPDEPSKGILRFTELKILTSIFVTQADILTFLVSTKVYTFASYTRKRSPTNYNFF